MAEWLRRLTRNQMGSSRVGSNPTRSEKIFDFFLEMSRALLALSTRPGKLVKLRCIIYKTILGSQISSAAMAEWLRRLTRNQMGSSRVGSNPTRSVGLFEFLGFL